MTGGDSACAAVAGTAFGSGGEEAPRCPGPHPGQRAIRLHDPARRSSLARVAAGRQLHRRGSRDVAPRFVVGLPALGGLQFRAHTAIRAMPRARAQAAEGAHKGSGSFARLSRAALPPQFPRRGPGRSPRCARFLSTGRRSGVASPIPDATRCRRASCVKPPSTSEGESPQRPTCRGGAPQGQTSEQTSQPRPTARALADLPRRQFAALDRVVADAAFGIDQSGLEDRAVGQASMQAPASSAGTRGCVRGRLESCRAGAREEEPGPNRGAEFRSLDRKPTPRARRGTTRARRPSTTGRRRSAMPSSSGGGQAAKELSMRLW